MHQIKVGSIEIEVARKDIKNLRLTIYPPNGRVRIATPLRINDESVRLFALSKLAWIKKHQANFIAQNRQTEREFISGESHYFKGIPYLLNLIEHKTSPKIIIRNNKYLELYMKKGSSKQQREKVIKEWYRQTLKNDIPALITKWQTIIGVVVADWGVKFMRTKWGTCNIQAKRLWLNLELAKKPRHCLEYVIVHEMVHLLERHHNKRFKAYMDKFMPQWRLYKDELNMTTYN
ncbi:MAG: SprT family zinc-dependent metalloprotease [Pseudomonadota bacterium]